MKKHFFWTVFLIFAIGFFFTIGLNALVSPQEGKKTPLAGNPSFPAEEYYEWMKVQVDPSIKDADKVACTVDTFFNLKYKSWMKLELLDFGFLFDRLDAQGAEDYAYERGFYYLWMVAWSNPKYPRNSLESYKYEPKYSLLSVDKDKAKVIMVPYATIVHSDGSGVGTTPWTKHTFTLIHKNDLWVITSVVSHDEMRDIYPPGQGTDFQKIADHMYEDEEKALIKQEAEFEELMKNDPRLQQEILSMHSAQKGVVGVQSYWIYYDILKARDYALQYSSDGEGSGSYNQLFDCYDNDCQNFVSQCVWYGFRGINEMGPIENHDLPMLNDSYTFPPHRKWWGDIDGSSSNLTWISIGAFTQMITDNYQQPANFGVRGWSENFRWARVGELIKARIDHPGELPTYHMMIISAIIDYDGDSGTDFNEAYICAHTKNRYNKRLSELFQTMSNLTFYTIHWFNHP